MKYAVSMAAGLGAALFLAGTALGADPLRPGNGFDDALDPQSEVTGADPEVLGGAQPGAQQQREQAGDAPAAQRERKQAGDAPAAQRGTTGGQQAPGAAAGAAGTGATLPALQLSAGQIAANPAQYYGRAVQVRAEVEDLRGPQLFTLDEDRAFAGPDVLVLAPNRVPQLQTDQDVTVTGQLRPLVRADFERDYDWFSTDALQPEVEVTFRERPVIIADSIITAEGLELVQAPASRGMAGDAPHGGNQPGTSGSGQPTGAQGGQRAPQQAPGASGSGAAGQGESGDRY